MANEDNAPARTPPLLGPPDDLPSDPAVFYAASSSLDELAGMQDDPCKTALERLGPPPFRRSGFPLLGFLATVYEHVAKCASESLAGDATPGS
ncbi:MAG: hypothetical protein ABII12_12690 [Planctomycetota bacterium]